MKKFWFYILFIGAVSCKEKYDLPVNTPATGYLVVEGVLNSGQGATTIKLSRTGKLNANDVVYENGANVQVEGDDNSSFTLTEKGNGTYSIDQLVLSSTVKYRLHINTAGKEYLSDFVEVRYSPPIDSVNWKREGGGVRVYVSSHDPQNNTRYYLWNYDETWEIHSHYAPSIKYYVLQTPTGPIYYVDYAPIAFDPTIYFCWQSHSSTELLPGSSEKLTQDIMYQPTAYIEQNSIKLSVLYSINVKQYALTKGAYEFLQKMKKNSETVGSIFDPQPSELKGNIRCITNPEEPVIGYVIASSIEEKRFFISNNEVPDWRYDPGCIQVVVKNQTDSVKVAQAMGLLPTNPKEVTFSIISFYAAPARCVDCTLSGTNIKPPFWP